MCSPLSDAQLYALTKWALGLAGVALVIALFILCGCKETQRPPLTDPPVGPGEFIAGLGRLFGFIGGVAMAGGLIARFVLGFKMLTESIAEAGAIMLGLALILIWVGNHMWVFWVACLAAGVAWYLYRSWRHGHWLLPRSPIERAP